MRESRLDELRFRKEFSTLPTMPVAELRRRQEQRFRDVIKHAFSNCDFYRRELNDIGVHPSELGVDEISVFPILSKEIIRENIEGLIAKNISPDTLTEASTGGSTGTPMRFYRDSRCLSMRRAQEQLFDSMMGYRVGDRAALFVAGLHAQGLVGNLKQRIRNRTDTLLLRFDPELTAPEYMRRYHADMLKFKPRFVKCFPNSFLIFTEFLNAAGLAPPPIEAISCTGENLYEWQKELFETTWQAPVFERYGTKECGVIAAEDQEHDGQLIFTEGVLVEILDDDDLPVGPGVIGRVIVTDLFNYGMPLIRYEIGDLAIFSSNTEAGIGLPKLDRIIGRDRDIIVSGDGQKRPGYLFVEAINAANINAKCQVIQRVKGQLELRIVGDELLSQDLSPMVARFRELLGAGGDVTVTFVNDIARDPSGKYRYVVSEIARTKTT